MLLTRLLLLRMLLATVSSYSRVSKRGCVVKQSQGDGRSPLGLPDAALERGVAQLLPRKQQHLRARGREGERARGHVRESARGWVRERKSVRMRDGA
jgi:hypothetical protein